MGYVGGITGIEQGWGFWRGEEGKFAREGL